MKKLSILIPVYNEDETIFKVLEIINNLILIDNIQKEVIVINDCSNDNSKSEIERFLNSNATGFTLVNHAVNKGKGAAIQTGIIKASGDYTIIQDADLELNPSEINNLIQKVQSNIADVVYGSRFLGGQQVRVHLFWNYLANKLLTLTTNILVNMNFTDMETGYKVFKRSSLESIKIEENSFTVEPEITIKLAKKKFIFYEVPISYYGRSYEEGKKIKLKDAFLAFYCLFKYRFF